MNCESCNAWIDYRFLTNCAHCDGEVNQASVSRCNAIPGYLFVDTVEKSLTWKEKLINTAYVLAGSLAGMISGAVVAYFFVGLALLAFFSGGGNPHGGCGGWNDVVLFLSVVLGAHLGTVGGSIFACKHPLCKATAK